MNGTENSENIFAIHIKIESWKSRYNIRDEAKNPTRVNILSSNDHIF